METTDRPGVLDYSRPAARDRLRARWWRPLWWTLLVLVILYVAMELVVVNFFLYDWA